MADAPATVSTPAPVPATPAAAPTQAAPAPAPVAAPSATPAVTDAAASTPAAPSTAAAPEPAAPVPAIDPAAPVEAAPADADTPSLLGEAAKPAPDPATAEPAPATPEAPVVETPAPPKYEFKWPEGVDPVPAADLEPLTSILAEIKAPNEGAQKLVDLHLAESQKLVERLYKQQNDTWNETRRQWVDAVRADPELGGNRFQTTVHVCSEMIRQFGGNPEQQAELRQVFDLTGAGDSPAVVRLINNIGKALRESRGPVVATQPTPAPTRKADRRYAGSMNGAA